MSEIVVESDPSVQLHKHSLDFDQLDRVRIIESSVVRTALGSGKGLCYKASAVGILEEALSRIRDQIQESGVDVARQLLLNLSDDLWHGILRVVFVQEDNVVGAPALISAASDDLFKLLSIGLRTTLHGLSVGFIFVDFVLLHGFSNQLPSDIVAAD